MKRRRFIKCLGCGTALAASQIDLWPTILGLIQNAYAFVFTK